MKKLLASLTLASVSISANANQPISVYLTAGPTNIRYVQVVSDVNQITIQNVIVNRGNCAVASTGARNDSVEPITLRYGEVANFRTYISNCNIREAQIVTNQGNWVFRF